MRNTALTLFVLLFLTSCADVETTTECLKGYQYGFWAGIWHGWIAPISFIGSLFNDDIAVYAANNTGGWYTFGFLLGIGSLGGSASKVSKR